MSSSFRLTDKIGAGLFAALLCQAVWPGAAAAQRRETRLFVPPGDAAQDIGELRPSPFRLFGEGDRAFTGLRPTGNTQWFVTNTGIIDAADVPIFSQVWLFGCALCADPNVGGNQFFDVSPMYGAPREEWVRFIGDVPSLIDAVGGGWTVSRNFPTLGFPREINASDRSFGLLFSGVETTTDGGCRDYSAFDAANPSASAGITLLAGSNCPPTWPLVNGEPAFLGDHPVTAEAFGMLQAIRGPDFDFEFWRVDPALVDPSKFFGNFQTYGAYDDFNSATLGRFGSVVPGGAGDPEDEGWPLGIRTEFQAFTFALPTVSNTMFWRALIINETEKLYGVPLDYENLYLGYSFMPLRGQETNFYAEVWRGAILTAESGTGSNPCPGTFPPATGTFIDCNNPGAPDFAFQDGATGVIVLKSPIGDLRNVLLTCSPSGNAQRRANRAIPCPTDAFFDPGNVHAGDTITYNHFRMCPFGACSEETYASSVDKRLFGGMSSNASLVLDGRSATDLPGGTFTQYALFRNPNYPQQVTPFAHWVPDGWDYSANGLTEGGDTLFVSTCHGPAGSGRGARVDACVVTWSDTMPVGELGNPTYNNQEGNISFWSVGPFPLAAGDTTALVVAMLAGIDSASFEAEVNNAIDLYMNFYLSPEAPPKVTVVGTDVQVINPANDPNATRGQVTLFWDDVSNDFVDPFLEDFANKLEGAAAGDLSRIRNLNPGLVDRIRERARDNLARILIFKSCDRGATFTAADTDARGDLDCDADPATDIQGGAVGGVGWQAFASLDVDASGNAPNMFVDNLVRAGQNYLYAVLGESRGGRFAIVDSVDVDGDGIDDALAPDSLVLAPPLINPLSRSTTESNVVSVYLPASTAAGSRPTTVTFAGPDPGFSTVPFTVVSAGGAAVEARYVAQFANEFEIARRDTLIADTTASLWQVTARDVVLGTDGVSPPEDRVVDSAVYTTLNPNGVTLTGAELTGDLTLVDGFGFVLVRQDTGEPLLVSTVLEGQNTTGPSFFGRSSASNRLGGFTGFPGFIVLADNTMAGQFNQQAYLDANGNPVPVQVTPTLAWDNNNSGPVQSGGISAFGGYSIQWLDRTFGPGSPFTLDEVNPSRTDSAFDASIEARAVGQVGRTDSVAAQALSDALGTTVAPGALVPVRLPFGVSNTTFGRTVDVAMLPRPSNTILLGSIRGLRTGETLRDTLSVTVAEDAWVPGDQLFFIETVELDSIAEVDGVAAVVLDETGQPIRVERTVVTFSPAILSCGNAPRASCNPVIGRGTSQDWVTNAAGQTLNVDYFAPFQLTSELVFDLEAQIVDEGIIAAGRDIAAQLDSVKVVPNPYIIFSEFQVATPSLNDKRLLFTHLPPEGTIRIFTVAGRFVQQIGWQPEDLAGNGDLFWDLRTREGNELGAGLYVFVVQARNPATGDELKKLGKFVVIR